MVGGSHPFPLASWKIRNAAQSARGSLRQQGVLHLPDSLATVHAMISTPPQLGSLDAAIGTPDCVQFAGIASAA
jgi:hypothetical protein